MNVLRSALILSSLATALAARADLINFDDAIGVVGNRYLATNGVSFVDGESYARPGDHSLPNVLGLNSANLIVSSPVNVLTGSVSFRYSSNSLFSGTGGTVPTLKVYSDVYSVANGGGTLLGTFPLYDTDIAFSTYQTATVSFAGAARSFVVNDPAFSHIVIDDLSFTSGVQATPEPATIAALGLGAAAMLRRWRKR